MANDIAVFVTYAAFLVDGNPLTNLMSIGGKTPSTGPDPPPPAIVGGLDTHAVFEGAVYSGIIIGKYLNFVFQFRGCEYDKR